MPVIKMKIPVRLDEVITFGSFVLASYATSLSDFTDYSSEYTAAYGTTVDTELKLVAGLIVPKQLNSELKVITQRIYLNQATVATSINLLEGYINRAVGLTIAAKDFGVKAVRNSNRSGDIEGLCTALDSLNKNVKVPANLAALIAKGYSAAKETAFETLISSLKGDNTAQNAKINQREVLVKNNHVAVNNIWAKINDLCDAGKRIYSTGADESKQQFTISTIKKRMRNDAKKTSITGVTIEPKARIEFKPLTVGRKRVVTTDAIGAYDLKGIMPGEYLGTLIVKGKPNVNADVVIVTGASVVENFGSIR